MKPLIIVDSDRIQSVRLDFEAGRVDRKLLARLYRPYADVGDVDQFVNDASRSFPEGNCGLASLYLRHLLKMGDIVQGRYGPHSHTFLKIGDDIIDITADQFGGPRTYVGLIMKPWSVES